MDWKSVFILLFFLERATAIVTRIEPTMGSVMGGSLIKIYGTGFSDQLTTDPTDTTKGNRVYLHNTDSSVVIECDVLSMDSTPQRILCESRPSPTGEGYYRLKVKVDGKNLNGDKYGTYCGRRGCFFMYKSSVTPSITSVAPKAGLPGDVITLAGQIQTAVVSMVSDGYDPDKAYIKKIYVGSNLCDTWDEENDQLFDASMDSCRHCRTEGKVKCKPVTKGIGCMNASFIVSNTGRSKRDKAAYFLNPEDEICLYETFADVTGVWPQKGSYAGGTLVKIHGRYFFPYENQVSVDVGGVHCKVQSVTENVITCITGKADKLAGKTFRAFPGGRGAKIEKWDKVKGFPFENIGSLNPKSAGYKTWNVRDEVENSYRRTANISQSVGRISGFFVAPGTGYFRFYVSADGRAELKLSKRSGPFEGNMETIAFCPRDAAKRLTRFSQQRSAEIYLKKGQPYYMEIPFRNDKQDFYTFMGFYTKRTKWGKDQMAGAVNEEQKIAISSQVILAKQVIPIENITSKFRIHFGGRTSVLLSKNDSATTFSNAFRDMFGKKCSYTLDTATGYLFAAFEDVQYWIYDAKVVSNFSPQCGRKCLRVGNYLLKSGQTRYKGKIIYNYMANNYPKLCFAYYGTLSRALRITFTFVNTTGDIVMATESILYQRPLNYNKWIWSQTCINVYESLLQKKRLMSEMHPYVRWIKVFHIRVFSDNNGVRLIDNLWIGKTDLSAILVEDQARPGGVFIDSYGVDKDKGRLIISLKPGMCYGGELPLMEIRPETPSHSQSLSGDRQKFTHVMKSVEIQRASMIVTGTFDLSYGNKTIEGIEANVSAGELKSLIESLFDTGQVTIQRQGNCSGYTWYVTWSESGGSKLKLNIAGANLKGNNVSVNSMVVTEGSITASPIPASFFRTPEKTPQVTVRINGVLSSCISGNCSFEYADIATPKITNIQPNSGIGNSRSSCEQVVIQGTGFIPNVRENDVKIGNATCIVKEARSNSIKCCLGNSTAGTYNVTVNVKGLGFSVPLSKPVTFSYRLQLVSLYPATGSAKGGTVITINGNGFEKNKEKLSVYLGKAICYVKSASTETILCVTSEHTQGAVDATITVNGMTASLQNAFTFIDSDVPLVTSNSVSTKTLSVGGGNVMLLTGKGLQSVTSVRIGEKNCTMISLSNDKLTCKTPPHNPGLHRIELLLISGSQAAFQNSADRVAKYCLEVTRLGTNKGSIAGGTVLTVKGKGFSTNSSDNVILIGDRKCRTISCTFEEIKCETPSNSKVHVIDNSGNLPGQEFGYQWKPSVSLICVGDYIKWNWKLDIFSKYTMEVYQTKGPTSDERVPTGFQAESRSSVGNFSYRFDTPGVFYFSSGSVRSGTPLRGRIHVKECKPFSVASVRVFVKDIEAKYQSVCTQGSTRSQQNRPSELKQYKGTSDGKASETNDDFNKLMEAKQCQIPDVVKPCHLNGVDTAIPCCNDSLKMNSESAMQFGYSVCFTPVVTNITSSESGADTKINIFGYGFSMTGCFNTITVGGYPCSIQESSSTNLMCRMNTSLEIPGWRPLKVDINVLNRGKALFRIAYTMRYVIFKPFITSIYPASGSLEGGTLITIKGKGFESDMKVDIGDKSCDIKNISYNLIVCSTPFNLSTSINDTQKTTVIKKGDFLARCGGKDSEDCNFKFQYAKTPVITSFSPTKVTSYNQNLTFRGHNLKGSEIVITIGESICNILRSNDSSITCNVRGVLAGLNLIKVVISPNGKAMLTNSNAIVSEKVLVSISPSLGSRYGGTRVVIVGNGFLPGPWSNNIKTIVTIGGKPCTLVENVTFSTIICIAPAGKGPATLVVTSNSQQFPSRQFSYTDSVTPQIKGISSNNGHAGDKLILSGLNFGTVLPNVVILIGHLSANVTSLNDSHVTFIAPTYSAGDVSIKVNVKGKGDSNTIGFKYLLLLNSVENVVSGYGGGTSLILRGHGFGRGNKDSVTVCGKICAITSLESKANLEKLTCITPALEGHKQGSGKDISCTIAVNSSSGETEQKINAYTYKDSLTAIVDEVNPTRGGTGGGTKLTIKGSGFGNSASSVQVKIGGVGCKIQTIKPSEITCQTGARNNTINALVQVSIRNGGLALTGEKAYFYYIDVWSSKFSWGGDRLPKTGDFVVISRGQTMLLDMDTPVLKVLLIKGGTLFFDEKDLHLQAEYIILAEGGKLLIGTEEKPFHHKAVITVHGHARSLELPIFGSKVIAVREGFLGLFGKHIPHTWTHLAETAKSGSTEIKLVQQAKGWNVGDQVILAATGRSIRENELVNITGIAGGGYILRINPPLKYDHIAISQKFCGKNVQTRGEVGLLSRNIVIQGSVERTWLHKIENCPANFDPGQFMKQTCFNGRYGEEMGSDQFGVQVMIHSGNQGSQKASAKFSYVEIRHAGQAFLLRRYPIHFHMDGDVSGSYVKGCAIHHSFQRAITIHGVHNLLVERNVVYNVLGHAIFMEDGIETGNIIQYNLGVFVKPSSSSLNVDVTPSTYWITNPNNTVRHNAAAAGSHFGYWLQTLSHPSGLSSTKAVCPRKTELQEFRNNTAHTFGLYGLWIFPNYTPKESSSCSSQVSKVASIHSFTAWNNRKGAEMVTGGAIQFVENVVLDNRDSGIEVVEVNDPEIKWGQAMVRDSCVIGRSLVTVKNNRCTSSGVAMPSPSFFTVSNVTFVNFDGRCAALTSCAQCKQFQGGFSCRVEKLNFVNTPNKMGFQWQHVTFLIDMDGSLSGIEGGKVLPSMGTLPPTLCQERKAFSVGHVNGSVCAASVSFHRFSFNRIQPTSFMTKAAFCTNQYGRARMEFKKKGLTHKFGWMGIILGKETCKLSFDGMPDINQISYAGVAYDMNPKDYFYISHLIPQKPDRVTIDGGYQNKSTSLPNPSSGSHGDWYYDNATNYLSYLVKGDPGHTLGKKNILLKMEKCKYKDCIPPTQPPRPTGNGTRKWSEKSSWEGTPKGFGGYNGKLPKTGENVMILSHWYMVLDVKPPSLNRIYVYGILELDPLIDHNLVANLIFIGVDNGRKGKFIVGHPDKPMINNVIISLTGDLSTPEFVIKNGANIGAKAIGVVGSIQLFGKNHTIYWTRLAKSVEPTGKILRLVDAVDWAPGDEIVISSSSFVPEEEEKHIIDKVSPDGQMLTLRKELAFRHLGTFHQMASYSLRLAAKVGLLSRNIVIQGVNNPAGSLVKDAFGGRLAVTWVKENDRFVRGDAQISNVLFKDFGQYGMIDDYDPRFGIVFLHVGDDGKYSSVTGCSFSNGYNSGIGLFGSNYVQVESNVLHRVVGAGVKIKGKSNIIRNNLVVFAQESASFQQRKSVYDLLNPGGFEIMKAPDTTLEGNVVAGSDNVGFLIAGEKCNSQNTSTAWKNNEVHGAWHGVHVPFKGALPWCVKISGFTIWKSFDYGIFAYPSSSIIVSNCIVGESANGLALYVSGPHALSHKTSSKSISVKDSLVFGISPSYDCKYDAKVSTCAKTFPSSHAARGVKGGFIGAMLSAFTSCHPRGPPARWDHPMCYPAISGSTSYTRVTFAYFKDDSCGKSHRIFYPNLQIGDVFHPIELKEIKLLEVDEKNKVDFTKPTTHFINPSDCVDMDCDGLRKILIRDIDGSMFGERMTSLISKSEYQWNGDRRFGLGDYRIPKTMLSRLDGTRIDPDHVYPRKGIVRGTIDRSFCQFKPEWNAYRCNALDYRMLVIESLDADTETRRLSPVALAADGYIDLINGPMDQGWCHGYTCQERISTFYTLVATQKVYSIFYTSYAPQKSRLHLLNSNKEDAVITSIYYRNPERLDVYVNGEYVPPTNAIREERKWKLLPNDVKNPKKFHPTLEGKAGDNFFDIETRLLYILLKGPQPVDIRKTQVIQLWIGVKSVAVTPSEFFKENLVRNLAALLRIPKENIIFMNVVQADSRRKRRSDQSTIEIQIGNQPKETLSLNESRNASESSSMHAGEIMSYDTLKNISEDVVEKFQIGNMSKAIGLEVGTLSVIEPEAEVVDPTNGIRATNETVQVANVTNTTLTYDKRMAMKGGLLPTEKTFLVPSKLKIIHQPKESNETVPFNISPELRVYDASGQWIKNLGLGRSVWRLKATLLSAAGSVLKTLDGNTTIAFVNGTAVFSNLAVSQSGKGYQLKFEVVHPADIKFAVVSESFDIKERKMYFQLVRYPSRANESIRFDKQPCLEVRDAANGKLVTNTGWKGRKWIFIANLIPGINSDSKLMGITSVTFKNGIASFTNLAIDSPGKDYKLALSAKTIPSSSYSASFESNSFDVYERPLRLHIAQQPGDCNATVPCGRQPVIEVRSVYQDALAGNLGWKGRKWSIRASLFASGSSDKLQGTLNIEIPSTGRAVFSDIRFSDVASGYKLNFTVDVSPYSPRFSKMSVISHSFNVKERQFYLAMIQSPSNANDSMVFGVQPRLEVRDVGTQIAARPLKRQWKISVRLANNAGGGSLSGTMNVLVKEELAKFTDLSISGYGVGYTLIFQSSLGHQVISQPFNVRYKNWHYPEFSTQNAKEIALYENATSGTLLATFKAHDADSGISGTIRYQLLSTNKSLPFRIVSGTGEFYLTQMLDREILPSYDIVIRATDQAPAPFEFSKDRHLRITVLDVNDNAPVFISKIINVTVLETASVGQIGFNVTAIDNDNAENGLISYILADRTNLPKFSLDRNTGIFKVSASLDLDQDSEDEPRYQIIVEARDHGHPPLSSQATVNVLIQRVNEFSPQFPKSAVSISMQEDTPINTVVYKAEAMDKDSGSDGDVIYSIVQGNKEQMFAIDQRGTITLQKALDREVHSSYKLIIHATDSSTTQRKSSVLTVKIAVKDVNDNWPTFEGTTLLVEVPDDAVINSVAGSLAAKDPDEGRNGSLSYVLINPPKDFKMYFTFDYSTGILKVKRNLYLDEERLLERRFDFKVLAKDNGIPKSLFTTVNVTLRIYSTNRFQPVLHHSNDLLLSIDYNQSPGAQVTKINATDNDYGPDGDLIYLISNGNFKNTFKINTKTGSILLAAQPTRSYFVLELTVRDNGKASSWKRVSLKLTVYISNYPGPSDLGKVYVGSEQGSTPVIISAGQQTTVPVYINSGFQDVEGGNLSIKFDSIYLRYEFADTNMIVKAKGNMLHLIGLVNPSGRARGIVKVADLVFTALLFGTTTLMGQAESVYDRRVHEIPPLPKQTDTVCHKSFRGDINQDCRFDLKDAVFAQSYIREFKEGFRSSYGKELKSKVNTQINSRIDFDKNHQLTYDDAKLLLYVLLGQARFISSYKIKTPNNYHDWTGCQFEIDVSQVNPDRSAVQETEWYIAFSHKSPILGEQLKDSALRVKASYVLDSANFRYGFLVPLAYTQTQTFSLKSSNSFLKLDRVGMTIVQVFKVGQGKTSLVAFYNNNIQSIQSKTKVKIEYGKSFFLSPQAKPQWVKDFNETTSYCKHPTIQISLRVILVESFDVIKNQETLFNDAFVAYVEKRYSSFLVKVRVVKIQRGSIEVTFNTTVRMLETEAFLRRLKMDIDHGDFYFRFNSHTFVAEKSLLVNGREALVSNVKTATSELSLPVLITIIVCTVLAVGLTIAIATMLFIRRRKKIKVFKAIEHDNKQKLEMDYYIARTPELHSRLIQTSAVTLDRSSVCLSKVDVDTWTSTEALTEQVRKK